MELLKIAHVRWLAPLLFWILLLLLSHLQVAFTSQNSSSIVRGWGLMKSCLCCFHIAFGTYLPESFYALCSMHEDSTMQIPYSAVFKLYLFCILRKSYFCRLNIAWYSQFTHCRTLALLFLRCIWLAHCKIMFLYFLDPEFTWRYP